MHYIGEMAALGTAFSWSATAIAFTNASRRIGSFTMSHYRMLFGVIILAILLLIFNGRIWPEHISRQGLFLLASSGFVGFFLCDLCLFQCYVDLGPRTGSLLFNSYPFLGALIAWHFLGEDLSRFAWLGMVVTFGGIAWVLMEKGAGDRSPHVHMRRGIMFAIGASIFQAIGLNLAKPALGVDGVDPLVATFIRAIFGGGAYWVVSIFRGRIGYVIKKSSDSVAMWQIAVGAFFGPSFGVWMMMVAVKYAPIGIAATIMALVPVIILPMTAIFYKERITPRMVLGAVIACLGVAILFNT